MFGPTPENGTRTIEMKSELECLIDNKTAIRLCH